MNIQLVVSNHLSVQKIQVQQVGLRLFRTSHFVLQDPQIKVDALQNFVLYLLPVEILKVLGVVDEGLVFHNGH